MPLYKLGQQRVPLEGQRTIPPAVLPAMPSSASSRLDVLQPDFSEPFFNLTDNEIERLHVAAKSEAPHDNAHQNALTKNHDVRQVAARSDRLVYDSGDDLLGYTIVTLRCRFRIRLWPCSYPNTLIQIEMRAAALSSHHKSIGVIDCTGHRYR